MQPSASTPEAAPRSLPEQWLERHGDALYRYALLLVRDEHRAEDLVQDTLIAAFEARDRFAAEASERTWLIAILRHKAIDQLRRNQRQEPVALDPAVEGNFNRLGKWRRSPRGWTPNPAKLLEAEEFWIVFRGCLENLPEQLQEAFVLRVMEELSASEVCRLLGISDTNLWTQMYRARERLRRCLEAKWFAA